MNLAQRLLTQNFHTEAGTLRVGGISVRDLAREFGTPLYVYDRAILERCYRTLQKALSGFAEIYYSIKANPNPAVARVFVELGAGLEIASAGEFELARAAGCEPKRIVFAGPGKTSDEIEQALAGGIGELHLESLEEIARAASIAARLAKTVPVAVRVNPSGEVQGGAMRMGGKPAAFGFDEEILPEVIAAVAQHPQLELCGLHMYAGTQILDADLLLAQWGHALRLASSVCGMLGRPVKTIDLGGGLGIPYQNADGVLDLDALRLGAARLNALRNDDPMLRHARVIVEPGRFLVGTGGVYLMEVNSQKISRGSRFVVTNGGMHHHLGASGNLGQVIKRDYPIVAATRLNEPPRPEPVFIAGPLCTPLDTLARQTPLPDLIPGDLIAVLQSGAYGLTASPTGFLSHPPPAEVLVHNGQARLIPSRGALSAMACREPRSVTE